MLEKYWVHIYQGAQSRYSPLTCQEFCIVTYLKVKAFHQISLSQIHSCHIQYTQIYKSVYHESVFMFDWLTVWCLGWWRRDSLFENFWCKTLILDERVESHSRITVIDYLYLLFKPCTLLTYSQLSYWEILRFMLFMKVCAIFFVENLDFLVAYKISLHTQKL